MPQVFALAADITAFAQAVFIRPNDKTPASSEAGVLEEMPDDDLLSHGEAPHYHRR